MSARRGSPTKCWPRHGNEVVCHWTGRCYETEGTPPFIPWVEVVQQSARIVPAAAFREALGEAAPEVAKLVPELRHKFPDIPPPIELPPEQPCCCCNRSLSQTAPSDLFSNFLEFLDRGARVTPHVILLDDLHWADDSTGAQQRRQRGPNPPAVGAGQVAAENPLPAANTGRR